jgi:prepilin-type N-terminal cleavage/methylation domain-containing protein
MSPTKQRAFSLIELLVVIAIIGLVIALVIPAVGKVREAARTTETRTLVSQVHQAASAFQIDNRRVPGVFSAVEMGQADNASRGFSGMQNAMLDLAGGLIDKAPGTAIASENEYAVGPYAQAARNVVVDLDLIGSGKGYFAPTGKFYQKQGGATGGSRVGASNGTTPHEQLPEVVDRNGQPILFWAMNDQASGDVQSIDDVVAVSSAAAVPARCYWNQNAAFLAAAAGPVGTLRVDQNTKSLLGESNGRRLDSLMAIMGNPNAPLASTITGQTVQLDQVLPAQMRGAFVVHASGKDGTYFSQSDTTSRLVLGAGSGDPWIAYGSAFYAPSGGSNGTRRTGTGSSSSVDIGSSFDDIIQAGE